MFSLSTQYVSLVVSFFFKKPLHSVHSCSCPFSQHSEVKGGPQRARTRTTRAVGVARNSAARECASPEIREDAPHFITTLMSCYNLYVRSAETLGFGVAVCEGSSCLSPGGRRVSVAGVTFNRLHCSRSFNVRTAHTARLSVGPRLQGR
jgi:hypothetical protein